MREAIRSWISEHSRKAMSGELTDATPIIEEGILSSVQVPDLILFIEELRGRAVDINELKPGAFRSVDAIVRTFLSS
jgi:acyl carrier protein